MNTILKYSGVVALVILAILVFLNLGKGQATVFGSASSCTDGYSCFTNVEIQGNQITDGTFKFGASGTVLNSVITGTCTGIVYASLAATTTAPIDCAVTGALSTAKSVVLSLPNEGAAGNGLNLVVFGAHASTTTGYITAYITNLTGVATTSYSQATTSMPVLVIQ